MKSLERLIAQLAPAAAARRARARLAFERDSRILEAVSTRRYDGASRGRRTKGWRAPSSSADLAIGGARVLMRDRSRDLVRNNTWAARTVDVVVNNVVGTGIRPQARPVRAERDSDRAKGDVERIAQLWREWAETTACDANGRLDFYGLQAQALRGVVESGEVLIRRRIRSVRPGRSIPVQLELIEPDLLDDTRDGDVKGGGWIDHGIEFDRAGRRVAYHLFPDHPGGIRSRRMRSIRVPAESVSHVFDPKRPGQQTGVPWLAPVIVPLRELAEFQDARLVREKVAALWAAFVTKIDPDGDAVDEKGANGESIEHLEPGIVEYLEPGESVQFGSPPQTQGYSEYVDAILRAVASAVGITFEALTGNLRGVSFSGGRMGWIEAGRAYHAIRQRVVLPNVCAKGWEWFLDAAELMGHDTDCVECMWTPPRRELIDPTREIPAMITAVRGGLMTLSEALRQMGYDPVRVFDEYTDERALLEKLGLSFDSTPDTAAAVASASDDSLRADLAELLERLSISAA